MTPLNATLLYLICGGVLALHGAEDLRRESEANGVSPQQSAVFLVLFWLPFLVVTAWNRWGPGRW